MLYNINAITKSIKKGIPYFRRTNGTRHWIKNLTPCTQFNISVTPSSFSQYRSEDVNSSKSVDIISTRKLHLNRSKLPYNKFIIFNKINIDIAKFYAAQCYYYSICVISI